jgi:GMP synthase-like glutamine amidotransferase
MRYLLVRHGPPRSPYNFEADLSASGSRLDTVLFSEGGRPDDPDAYDAVVVFGGYMYATEDDKHPWIRDELGYMESAIKAGVPLLGICLGGQLLARLLGARVFKTPVPEFGYWPIERTEAGRASPLFEDLPVPLLGFLWHNDAFDLPSGAVRLARTEHCPNQAFSYGDRTFGLQFHLEFSAEQLRSMVTRDSSSLPAPSAVWQDPAAVAANEAAHAEVKSSMLRMLRTVGGLRS